MRTVVRISVGCELLDDAEDLEAGTPVFGMIQRNQAGGCADVASLGANEVARKPSSLSMLEAASLPLAGLTALQALRDRLALRSGERILINGASGGVGTLAVQIAKAMGARVEAVCSARNAERVSDLGADEVIDYANTRIEELRDFDCVFDVFGSFAWSKARPALRTGGRYCTTIPRPSSLLHGALSRIGLHRAAFVIVKSRRCDLDRLRRWVEEGQLRPVIDRVFPLAECAAAHAYLETRRARGKVVLQLKG